MYMYDMEMSFMNSASVTGGAMQDKVLSGSREGAISHIEFGVHKGGFCKGG